MENETPQNKLKLRRAGPRSVYNHLGIFQVVLGGFSILVGFMLFFPEMQDMVMVEDIISDYPYHNFILPGLINIGVLGFGNLIGARYSFNKDLYTGPIAIGLGLVLIIFVLLQAYALGYDFFLHSAGVMTGLTEVLVGVFIYGLERKMRREWKKKKALES